MLVTLVSIKVKKTRQRAGSFLLSNGGRVFLSGGEEPYRDHTSEFHVCFLFLVSIRSQRTLATRPADITQPAKRMSASSSTKLICRQRKRAWKKILARQFFQQQGDCSALQNRWVICTRENTFVKCPFAFHPSRSQN